MAVELEGRLEEVVDHGADTRSLFLRLPVDLDFRPGQFISCQLPVGDKTLIRPYSIASSPEEPRRLEILLNLVPGGPRSEEHTSELQSLRHLVCRLLLEKKIRTGEAEMCHSLQNIEHHHFKFEAHRKPGDI